MNKNLLLVLHPVNFTNYRFKKYELELFKRNGFNIIIHDLQNIIFGFNDKSSFKNDFHKIQFNSILDWENELFKLKNNNYEKIIVYNFLLGYSKYENCVLFKKLRILNCSNIFFLNSGTFNKNYSSKFISFNILIQIFHHLKLNFKYLNVFNNLRKLGFVKNKILVGSLSELRNLYLASFFFNLKIIKGHCWDLSNLYFEKIPSIYKTKLYGVLLDGAGPIHSNDNKLLNKKPSLTIENWYPSLCNFFDFIEKLLNLKIVIKGHYSFIHPDKPDYFGYRNVFNDSLFELVMQSNLVITRMSTSLILAIYFNKPIVLITSNEHLLDNNSNIYQKNLARFLRCTLVNLDLKNSFNDLKISELDPRIKSLYLKNFGSLSSEKKSNASLILKSFNYK